MNKKIVLSMAVSCLLVVSGCSHTKKEKAVTVKNNKSQKSTKKTKSIKAPRIGDKAPNFSLMDTQGNSVSLSQFAGKKVAIYFYPKDGTPGCTKQAKSLRDGIEKLHKNNIVVLGVSADSVKSHQEFKKKYQLPFILLSDSKDNVVRAYGVKGMFGMAKRVTFLIDEQGIVVDIIKEVKTSNHADQVLSGFAQVLK